MKATYMLLKLLCAHRMTKYVCRILLSNSERLLTKLQNIVGTLFAAPMHNVY